MANVLLQCELTIWITDVKEEVVPDLLDNIKLRNKKYWVDKAETCSNRYTLFERGANYQFSLRQVLNNPSLLPHFSLTHKPHIDPVLYQRLKARVAEEDNYIWDNTEELEEEMGIKQQVSEEYVGMQKVLLEKVKRVEGIYSMWLFLEMHLQNWEILNCKGLQEYPHSCLKKGVACKVRLQELCGCRDVLLHCRLVMWIEYIQVELLPRLKENRPDRRDKFWTDTEDYCANRNKPYE